MAKKNLPPDDDELLEEAEERSKLRKNAKKDRKYIQSKIGWKKTHYTARKMATSITSNFNAPKGMQIEDPAVSLLEDGFERLQYFRGNRFEAVADGDGEQIDHTLRAWIDPNSGEYLSMMDDLAEKGYKVTSYDPEKGILVEKEVTVAEAVEMRRQEMGRSLSHTSRLIQRVETYVENGEKKYNIRYETKKDLPRYLDDDPELEYKYNAVRHSLGELELPGKKFKGELGKRDRKDRDHNDPEDVPWKDTTDSDWFGTGVQTTEVIVPAKEDPATRKSATRTETFWFQEKAIWGPVQADDGSFIEAKIGREFVARPFSDLIMPVPYAWWEVLDENRQMIEGLNIFQFKNFFQVIPELKRQIDEVEPTVSLRGTSLLPWGDRVIRVHVEIPEGLKQENELLLAVERFSTAKYFAFDVKGPAVPALEEEFLKKCYESRRTQVRSTMEEASDERLKELTKARKALEASRKAQARLQEAQWGQEWPEIQKKLLEPVKGFQKPFRKEYRPTPTKICKICGRRVDPARVRALTELMRESDDIASCIRIEESMNRCLRRVCSRCTKMRCECPEGFENKAPKILSYCDGSDLGKSSVVSR